MIINLICGDNIFTSNEKQWNKIRGIISSASQEFILDYKNNMLNHEMKDDDIEKNSNSENKDSSLNDLNDLDNSDDCKEYNYYQKTLYEKSVNKEIILKTINNIKPSEIVIFTDNNTKKNTTLMNTLFNLISLIIDLFVYALIPASE